MIEIIADTINIEVNVAGDLIVNFYSEVALNPYSVLITQSAKGDCMTPDKPSKAPAGKPTPAHSKPKPGGNGIPAGGQGTFQAQLLNAGVPMDLPPGSSWQWSDDDPSSTITMDPSDPTGATVIVTVPASDTASQLILTAVTTDPNGNAVTGTLTVPVNPEVSVFTVVITQTA